MVSKKRSARAKQVAQFKAQLEGFDGAGGGGLEDLFNCEEERLTNDEIAKEAVLRHKACESKNRYSCRSDAEAAIASCAEHGTKGLHSYRCPYCRGWHLTSKPVQ